MLAGCSRCHFVVAVSAASIFFTASPITLPVSALQDRSSGGPIVVLRGTGNLPGSSGDLLKDPVPVSPRERGDPPTGSITPKRKSAITFQHRSFIHDTTSIMRGSLWAPNRWRTRKGRVGRISKDADLTVYERMSGCDEALARRDSPV